MGRRKKEEEVFHVEVITKARVSEDSDWEYLVKWAGYGSDADSWEPSGNVKQCERLLASFWKQVGMDNEDYPIGYEVAAGEDWISKEKRYFAETFVKSSKNKSHKGKSKRDGQESRKSKSSTPPASESSADHSEASDEAPAAKTHTKLKRRTLVADTESESDSDSESKSDDHLRNHCAKIASHPKPTAIPSRAIPKANPVKQQELPSATSSSSTTAPPKVTAVRTHQDQRTNPLVKPMNLPSKSVGAGSSLSTKQRIAAGIPAPPIGPKPLPLTLKKPLPQLSFKKNKPFIPLGNQTKDTTISSTPVATPISPVINDMDMVASPQPMEIDQPVDLFDFGLGDAGLPDRSSETITVPIPPKSQKEINAEQFLQTIHLPALSGPLETAVTSDQPDQPSTELNKTLTIPKIPKKWKWSGDLSISTSENKTELLCSVTITDPNGMGNSSYIHLFLSSQDSLHITKLYPIMDLSPLLRACGKPQYFGRLEPSEPSEEVTMHGLEHHMTSDGLAAAIPLFLEETEVAAVLVVFPGAQQGLTKVLQVPEHLLFGTPLLVVLLPFFMSTVTSTNAPGWKSIEKVFSLDPEDVLVPHELPQEAVLHQAMSLLYFPKALLNFLNNSPTTRAYCVWPSPDQLSPDLDTAMLQCILKSTKAASAKLEEEVRIVFISNRHLDMIHTMPSLVNKRVNSPEIQFWTYGHSSSITYKRWRVQEIYPLGKRGGIVTFTVSALAEDPVGCYQLICQIIEHPLWDCYLIPEVLALSHLLCIDGGISVPSESHLRPILDFIDLGLISVTRMPENGHASHVTWLSQAFDHTNASGHELLETCLGVLRSHPTTPCMTSEQLVSFTNSEVIKDLSNAQTQPVFMENYRRFVVIRAASEDSIPFDKGGLEWLPLSSFSFKDDYFQSQAL